MIHSYKQAHTHTITYRNTVTYHFTYTHIYIYIYNHYRQRILEEALLFSGQLADAIKALLDWLYGAELQLTGDDSDGGGVLLAGDLDTVNNLIEQYKVRNFKQSSTSLVKLICNIEYYSSSVGYFDLSFLLFVIYHFCFLSFG